MAISMVGAAAVRWRGRRWSPDKRGLVKAAVGLAAAAADTALPLGTAADAILAVARLGDPEIDAWHDRLVAGVERWARAHPQVVDELGGLPTGWEGRLLGRLAEIDAAVLLGSDERTRPSVEEALARSVFTPLVAAGGGWDASRAAARELLSDLPGLVVEASGPDPGLAALRQVLKGDLGELLDRRLPGPAQRAALEAYLTALVDVLDEDAWTHEAGGRVSSVTTIARRLTVHSQADTGYGRGEQPTEVVDDADELLGRCHRLVVLGGPGAGKTWLARRGAIAAAEAALEAFAADADPETVEVPLFARCAAVMGADADAWEAVVAGALREVGHRLRSGEVTQALRRRFLERSGRYLVVLDGLDEAEHLPTGDLLARLATTTGRDLRILVTTRPSSWRRQLPLDQDNRSHRLASLQPLRYPEDVAAVAGTWLADQPEARDRLLTLLERRSDLAEIATTPLLCAMYCLLAGTGDPLPRTRRKLHERIVTRLLQGTWHQQLGGHQLEPARKALRQLAWAGAVDDPATGLGAWPEDVPAALDPATPEPVLTAVSHVAPLVRFDPDEAAPARRFLHRSIREHLLAEYLADLPAAEAAPLIEPHLWYDPEWEQVVPAAVAGHRERDALLRTLLVGEADAPATSQAVDRRDGFGELRRLLRRLASETSPADWSQDHEALIDGAARGLGAAAMGWPGARPGPRELARLYNGDAPWPQEELRDWIGYADLPPGDRTRLVRSLVEPLRTGRRRDGVDDLRWEVNVAIVLDVLASPQHRAAALEGLSARLRDNATPQAARAYQVLAGGPAPEGLIQAVREQFDRADEKPYADRAAVELARTLALLGADPTVRRGIAGRLVDRLAALPDRVPEHSDRLTSRESERAALVEAIVEAGPDAAQLARAVHLLIGVPDRLDSAQLRELRRQLGTLLAASSDTGAVLRRLTEDGGPWERTREAKEVLGRLVAAAGEEDRRVAAAAVRRRIEKAAGWERYNWVELLTGLRPTAEERAAVIEHLLGRLPGTPVESIGLIAEPVRMLGPDREQRRRLVRHLVGQLGWVPEASWLCRMVSWFLPEGEARSATVARLIESAASLRDLDRSTWSALEALRLTDDERRRLVDALTSSLLALTPWDTHNLAQVILQFGPTPQQRAAAVDLLLARLWNVGHPDDLVPLLTALREVNPVGGWRAEVAAVVLAALLAASPGQMRYDPWRELLPELLWSADDRRRAVDALVRHLRPSVDPWKVLELVDALEPTDQQQAAITGELVMSLMEARWDHEATSVGRLLAGRKLSPEQRQSAVQRLLRQLGTAHPSARPGLLRTVAGLDPDGDQRRSAVAAALQCLGQGGMEVGAAVDALLALGELEEQTRREAVEIALDQFAVGRGLGVTEGTGAALVRLGFDATALARLADRRQDYPYAESILRDLGRSLRRASDAASWRAALAPGRTRNGAGRDDRIW